MQRNHQLFFGKVKQQYDFNTAIDKTPIVDGAFLTVFGFEGDECADPKHHGGLERAVHHYPAEHYAYWMQQYPERDWQAPGMGENISTLGMTEDTVCIGDRYQWGEAIVEVSQPRSPCYKLNKIWQVDKLSVEMQNISRCGWLYRVIQPGFVRNDDQLVLIQQAEKPFTVKQVCDMFFGEPLNPEYLMVLEQCTPLSNSWRDRVTARIETGVVENWNFRLLGHA
jgi:MOSC domain-containing protein YiiM